MDPKMKLSLASSLFTLAGALALAACASAPPAPNDALQAADIAVGNAQKDRAADYAPLEMKSAQDKLAAARATKQPADDDSVALSRRLAEEARLDAELASAKAQLAKADAVNGELKKNSDTLRQEVQRGSGS
jgi:hypothetical protein